MKKDQRNILLIIGALVLVIFFFNDGNSQNIFDQNECNIEGNQFPCCEFTGSEAQQFAQLSIEGDVAFTGVGIVNINNLFLEGVDMCVAGLESDNCLIPGNQEPCDDYTIQEFSILQDLYVGGLGIWYINNESFPIIQDAFLHNDVCGIEDCGDDSVDLPLPQSNCPDSGDGLVNIDLQNLANQIANEKLSGKILLFKDGIYYNTIENTLDGEFTLGCGNYEGVVLASDNVNSDIQRVIKGSALLIGDNFEFTVDSPNKEIVLGVSEHSDLEARMFDNILGEFMLSTAPLPSTRHTYVTDKEIFFKDAGVSQLDVRIEYRAIKDDGDFNDKGYYIIIDGMPDYLWSEPIVKLNNHVLTSIDYYTLHIQDQEALISNDYIYFVNNPVLDSGSQQLQIVSTTNANNLDTINVGFVSRGVRVGYDSFHEISGIGNSFQPVHKINEWELKFSGGCVPNWQPVEWGACVNDIQEMQFNDNNNCNIPETIPTTTRECTIGCADDVSECSDGNFVSRNESLSCEFNACPATTNEGFNFDDIPIWAWVIGGFIILFLLVGGKKK